MLVSSRQIPIGNASNMNLWRQELFSTKGEINENQIKAMSGHGSHAILVLLKYQIG